jgi:multidrug efflux pump
MSRFFIDRPIFAWVIALFIMVFGGVAITQLPMAQYPTVAPPSVVITATYPGASAKTLDEAVVNVIEQELNGAPGLAYMESVSQANGTASITVTFETGTNIDLAQVEVQNRLARATPRLPSAVTQQGVRVEKSRSNILMFAMLSSSNPAYDPVALGDYASRNLVPEMLRVPGVGQVTLFGTERAMRIWVDPAKLVSFGLSVTDVNNAIRAQNALVPAGGLGERPTSTSRPSPPPWWWSRPAHQRRAVRQHRAARQGRRLHRAPQGRGPHRDGRRRPTAPTRA